MIESESDPLAIASRIDDDPGSFLDLYRCINIGMIHHDQDFVNKAVVSHIIPESVRYSILTRPTFEVYRGIIKSTDGSYHYFQWTPDTNLKLFKADTQEKIEEAQRFYKGCQYGCDLIKASPLDSEETVEEATEEEDKAVQPELAASPVVSEQEWVDNQNSRITDVHPGSTAAASPDDQNNNTQNWHTASLNRGIQLPSDGLNKLASNDGVSHWTATQLVKSWAGEIKKTISSTQIDPFEKQYAKEVLGITDKDLSKGFRLNPFHQREFILWKNEKLRDKMTKLHTWLGNRNG